MQALGINFSFISLAWFMLHLAFVCSVRRIIFRKILRPRQLIRGKQVARLTFFQSMYYFASLTSWVFKCFFKSILKCSAWNFVFSVIFRFYILRYITSVFDACSFLRVTSIKDYSKIVEVILHKISVHHIVPIFNNVTKPKFIY